MSRWDVAVVGGGPAGCATALALRAHAPALRVVLVEASRYERERIGETLPPQARPLLERLGVWQAFEAQGHRVVWGTVASWGVPVPLANDFLFGTSGHGWQLDRTAFDRMLALEAERRGVALLLGTRGEGVAGEARFVVDATGSGQLARRRGARLVRFDRLLAFARFFDGDAASDPRTLVEPFADGWWYTAGLPGGRRVAACLTDAAIARRLRLADGEAWTAQLAATATIAPRCLGARPRGGMIVRSACSRRLEPVADEGWLAVGDAASGFDPLSSQGIVKALRSGVVAAYAVGDWLTGGDAAGIRRYRRFARAEVESYLETRARWYGVEARWPRSEFWRDRAAFV